MTQGAIDALLVVSHGAHPDARQRQELAPLLQDRSFGKAMMTDSAIVRGTLTVFRWMGGQIKAFPLGSFEAACDYLQMSDRQPALEQTVKRFEAQLGVGLKDTG